MISLVTIASQLCRQGQAELRNSLRAFHPDPVFITLLLVKIFQPLLIENMQMPVNGSLVRKRVTRHRTVNIPNLKEFV